MIKQIDRVAETVFIKTLIFSLSSISAFAIIDELAEYFYSGKIKGKVDPLKLRTQQLVSKKNITNSYMLGLMYGLLVYYALPHYSAYKRNFKILSLFKKEDSIAGIEEALSAYSTAYRLPYSLDEYKKQYQYLGSLHKFKLLFNAKSQVMRFGNVKLEYNRPLSDTEFYKGVKTVWKHTNAYYLSGVASISTGQKNQDKFHQTLCDSFNNFGNDEALQHATVECLRKLGSSHKLIGALFQFLRKA